MFHNKVQFDHRDLITGQLFPFFFKTIGLDIPIYLLIHKYLLTIHMLSHSTIGHSSYSKTVYNITGATRLIVHENKANYEAA